jgi:F-type H+-transporting ATPase subunit b
MTRQEQLWRAMISVISGVALILLPAVSAFAAESGTPVEETTTGWVFRWINFLIVLGAIVYFMRKVAAPQFREHAQGIERSIQEATETHDAAARELKAEEGKLAALPAEISRMHELAKHDTAAEGERLRSLLVMEIEKIKDAARAEMEGAQRVMRLELKAAAARMAVERAEALLHERMTPQVEAALIHQFVEDLVELPR